jgi:hypothetical protein
MYKARNNTQRNRWREQGPRRSAAEIAYVTAAQTDWIQQTEGRGVLPEFRQTHGWRNPEPGVLKLNSDGAFDVTRKEGGWGFAIHDDQGSVVCQALAVKTISWMLSTQKCSDAWLDCKQQSGWGSCD